MASIVLRKAKEADIPYLTSHWLKAYRNAPAVRGVPNKVYFYYHHKVLEELLRRATTVIACYEDMQDHILGFACFEKFDSALVLHFVEVRESSREMKVAKFIVKEILEAEGEMPVVYTHKTPDIFPIERKLKDMGWIYHPYLLWTSMPEGWEDEA